MISARVFSAAVWQFNVNMKCDAEIYVLVVNTIQHCGMSYEENKYNTSLINDVLTLKIHNFFFRKENIEGDAC